MFTTLIQYVFVCVCLCICVSVCVCVWEGSLGGWELVGTGEVLGLAQRKSLAHISFCIDAKAKVSQINKTTEEDMDVDVLYIKMCCTYILYVYTYVVVYK